MLRFFGLFTQAGKKLSVYLHRPAEGHGGNHAGVADGLEFHVTAVGGALQLDDNEVGVLINGKEVNAAAAVLPIAKLLGDHIKIVAEHFYLSAQQALQIAALAELHLCQGSFCDATKGVGSNFV